MSAYSTRVSASPSAPAFRHQELGRDGQCHSGVETDPFAVVLISSSVISANATGIQAGAGSTVTVRDSDIFSNAVGLSGTVQSFVNNAFVSNGAVGTIVPVADGVTNPQGLQ